MSKNGAIDSSNHIDQQQPHTSKSRRYSPGNSKNEGESIYFEDKDDAVINLNLSQEEKEDALSPVEECVEAYLKRLENRCSDIWGHEFDSDLSDDDMFYSFRHCQALRDKAEREEREQEKIEKAEDGRLPKIDYLDIMKALGEVPVKIDHIPIEKPTWKRQRLMFSTQTDRALLCPRLPKELVQADSVRAKNSTNGTKPSLVHVRPAWRPLPSTSHSVPASTTRPQKKIKENEKIPMDQPSTSKKHFVNNQTDRPVVSKEPSTSKKHPVKRKVQNEVIPDKENGRRMLGCPPFKQPNVKAAKIIPARRGTNLQPSKPAATPSPNRVTSSTSAKPKPELQRSENGDASNYVTSTTSSPHSISSQYSTPSTSHPDSPVVNTPVSTPTSHVIRLKRQGDGYAVKENIAAPTTPQIHRRNVSSNVKASVVKPQMNQRQNVSSSVIKKDIVSPVKTQMHQRNVSKPPMSAKELERQLDMADWQKILEQLPFGAEYIDVFTCMDGIVRYKIRKFRYPSIRDGVCVRKECYYRKIIDEDGTPLEDTYHLVTEKRLKQLILAEERKGSSEAPIDLD
ncbi:hypothetical protein L596_024549 [Steinernema carpocapsae]|uniref:Uncharacterized protein n=1 Tax=Steinernema carpocapsae TaxID=34508 RepID=A0A4V5ZZR5_STECR|nr:hypothetical protein L596_024549 [Steinernema carpocapsae]